MTSTNKPLTLTVDDLTQTRDRQPTTLHMRWPSDPETTRRLLLLTHEQTPWWRRLPRLIPFLRQRP
jgi:hypothetical protein